jgi:hypothetical protein
MGSGGKKPSKAAPATGIVMQRDTVVVSVTTKERHCPPNFFPFHPLGKALEKLEDSVRKLSSKMEMCAEKYIVDEFLSRNISSFPRIADDLNKIKYCMERL